MLFLILGVTVFLYFELGRRTIGQWHIPRTSDPRISSRVRSIRSTIRSFPQMLLPIWRKYSLEQAISWIVHYYRIYFPKKIVSRFGSIVYSVFIENTFSWTITFKPQHDLTDIAQTAKAYHIRSRSL